MFERAIKKNLKLRLAIFGASGSGKTYSALRIATGLAESENGKIAYIDTERGSASKYADRFDFDVVEIETPTINEVVKLIGGASGYSVLIIDSLSHPWKELLLEVDKIARAKYRGNTWSAWSEGGQLQDKLINAILGFNGHVIATMRSKTEWLNEKDETTGKTKPVRIGLSPEQGKGIEYEFDMLMEMNTAHFASVIKDRTGKYQDAIIEKPQESFGTDLYKWLNSGIDMKKVALEAINKTNTIGGLIALFASYDSNIQSEIKSSLSERKNELMLELANKLANDEITTADIQAEQSLPEKTVKDIINLAIDIKLKKDS